MVLGSVEVMCSAGNSTHATVPFDPGLKSRLHRCKMLGASSAESGDVCCLGKDRSREVFGNRKQVLATSTWSEPTNCYYQLLPVLRVVPHIHVQTYKETTKPQGAKFPEMGLLKTVSPIFTLRHWQQWLYSRLSLKEEPKRSFRDLI